MYLTRLWYLKNIDIFSHVPEERLKRTVSFTSMSRVGRYQDICFPEKGAGHVFLIQKGSIKLSRLLHDGRSLTFDVLYAGDIYGEHPVQQDGERNEYAEAVDDVVICAITKQSFRAMLEGSPELHFYLPRKAVTRPQEFKINFGELAFKTATERIIHVLCSYGERFGRPIRGSRAIELPLSTYEIALLTGLSLQAALTALEELKGRKLMDFSPDFLVIYDPSKWKDSDGIVQKSNGMTSRQDEPCAAATAHHGHEIAV
jgi:CRP/FNR family transcriptional regulator